MKMDDATKGGPEKDGGMAWIHTRGVSGEGKRHLWKNLRNAFVQQWDSMGNLKKISEEEISKD